MRFYLFLTTLFVLSLLPRVAAAQGCCTAPTSESTAGAGFDPRENLNTVEMFVMTLSGGAQWGGGNILEQEAALGTDSCYVSQSPYTAMTTVTGTSWTIGTALPTGLVTVGPAQWGADEIGYGQPAASWYRINLAKYGKSLPCGFTLHQNIQFTCPSGGTGEDIFYNLTLSATIVNATSVYDCRDGTCVTVNN
jgi:hypothetical protein